MPKSSSSRGRTGPRTGGRRRVGRPTRAESERLGQRLRRAAVEVFLEHGFDGASMEAVAQTAGITKRTLYSRYPDKEALFAEVIPWAMTRQGWDDPPVDLHGGDLAAGLLAIARAAVKRAVDPEIVRLSRVVMNESARFPEFARSAHSLAWSPRMRVLIDLLVHHSREGGIVVEDPELVAEQFLAMVSLMPARLAAFGVFRDPEAEERHIQHAVALFLRGVLPR